MVDAETRYTEVEKFTLALLTAAQKLRPYFQAHTIVEGSGVGILLLGLRGVCVEHALHFHFKAGNNEVEYEAILVGLKLAEELEVKNLLINSGSQLITEQMKGDYEAKGPNMVKYLATVRKFLAKIPKVEINPKGPASIRIEILPQPSISIVMVVAQVDAEPSWMDSIKEFLLEGKLLEYKNATMSLRKRSARYSIINGELYRRSFTLPYLRCLAPRDADYALREVYEGVCGSHIRGRTLSYKVLRCGYCWPTMMADAKKGMNLLGSFPSASAYRTFLIVVVDYFTKWIEVEPLAVHLKEDLGIKLRVISVSHPQANGQAEVTNQVILQGLKTRLDSAKGRWVEELPSILWSYQTTARTSTGETPFSLAFEEARKETRVRIAAYRQRTARYYNRRVKERKFSQRDLVLRKTEVAGKHLGKLEET
ncbi:uncharacterized protein LOC119986902 [Tripterygium wilfordii]|uniref:uncharacterized protein LOC119986902 n=1 Tax=Tripterygium wilfordii TaxID=458696 RepID=UPI0018F83D41|nr:uncharacterized protein LOC119986902 [Tripterygium wilfordii]